jgi:hypothetical protein
MPVASQRSSVRGEMPRYPDAAESEYQVCCPGSHSGRPSARRTRRRALRNWVSSLFRTRGLNLRYESFTSATRSDSWRFRRRRYVARRIPGGQGISSGSTEGPRADLVAGRGRSAPEVGAGRSPSLAVSRWISRISSSALRNREYSDSGSGAGVLVALLGGNFSSMISEGGPSEARSHCYFLGLFPWS